MISIKEDVEINERKTWTKPMIIEAIGLERYNRLIKTIQEKQRNISASDFTPFEISIIIDLTRLKTPQRDFAYLYYVKMWTLEEIVEYMEHKYNNVKNTSYASVYKYRISQKLKDTCVNVGI